MGQNHNDSCAWTSNCAVQTLACEQDRTLHVLFVTKGAHNGTQRVGVVKAGEVVKGSNCNHGQPDTPKRAHEQGVCIDVAVLEPYPVMSHTRNIPNDPSPNRD